MNKSIGNKVVALTIGFVWVFALVVFASSPVLAQEKHKRTYTDSAENSEYVTQHSIDATDIPGHVLRVVVIRRTAGDNPVTYEGVAVKETYEYVATDYVNWSGTHRGYGVLTMENGDKIYTTSEGTTHTTQLPGGGAKGTFAGTGKITGGTGKFKGIRGTFTYTGIFDPAKGINENTTVEEYWME